MTPLIPSGIILALDKDAGKTLWQFSVGAPLGIGGPSMGHGMLFVTTGSPAEISSNNGGYIVAFGLPSQNQSITTSLDMKSDKLDNGSNSHLSNDTTSNPIIQNTTDMANNNTASGLSLQANTSGNVVKNNNTTGDKQE